MSDALTVRPPSAPISKLAEALAKASDDFGEIQKDATVDIDTKGGGSFTFRYATLAAIYKAVRPALAANGLSVVHVVDGATLVTMLLHVSGESISSSIPIGQPSEWKQYGGALTYAKRYAVGGLLAVAADDDTDAKMLDGHGPDHEAQRTARAPRQRSIHEAPSTARERQHLPDARQRIHALMKPLAFTETERDGLFVEYKDNPDGLIAHLEALTDAPAKPEPGDANYPF